MIKEHKTLFIVLVIVLVVAIIEVGLFYGYKYHRYKVCINDKSYLDYEVVSEKYSKSYEFTVITLSNPNIRVHVDGDEVIGVINEELNYTKLYSNGVLFSMYVRNDLNYYLNRLPFVNMIKNDSYVIRSNEEISELIAKMDETDKTYYLDKYLMID